MRDFARYFGVVNDVSYHIFYGIIHGDYLYRIKASLLFSTMLYCSEICNPKYGVLRVSVLGLILTNMCSQMH